MDARRLVHEGRCWLESEGLMHLVDDPYTREEILTVVNVHYPKVDRLSGLRTFYHDLTGWPQAVGSDRGSSFVFPRPSPTPRAPASPSARERLRREAYERARLSRLQRLAPGSRKRPAPTAESKSEWASRKQREISELRGRLRAEGVI